MLNENLKAKWFNWESITASLSFFLTMALPCSAAAFLVGCVSIQPKAAGSFQAGESVILVGEEPASLAFATLLSQPVDVRSTYRDGLPQTFHYESGRDYVLDESGQIRRTPDSRIPDFHTNVLYGKEDFNPSKFPGFGNNSFFVYVDYFHLEQWSPVPLPVELGAMRLSITQKKLSSGEKIRIVVYGDSITAGAGASDPGLIFWKRWVDALRLKYPRATIETVNSGMSGESTWKGWYRLFQKVIAHNPDLVLIGFGMNDHNRDAALGGIPPSAYSDNLNKMIDRIRADNGAEIILLSTFPPNPKWYFGSHNMAAYAAATEQVAREKQCAYADVYHLWVQFAEKKKPEDLLDNNVNHPNDFGHWIYFQALESLNL